MLASAGIGVLVGLPVNLFLLWVLVRWVRQIEGARVARELERRERWLLIGPTRPYAEIIADIQTFVKARHAVRLMGGPLLVWDETLMRETHTFNEWAAEKKEPRLLPP